MSYRGKSRGRGRSGGGGDSSSRYSEHDDRVGDNSKRDYDDRGGSYQGKMRGFNRPYNNRGRRGGSSNYRSSHGNYNSSRGSYNNSRGSNYRGNRGRRPYRGGPSRDRFPNKNDNKDNSSPLEDEDGDFNMEEEGESSSRSARYNPYARPSRDTGHSRNKPEPRQRNWYQITILDGHTYDEEWLKDEIQSAALIQFHPVQYHIDGQKSSFFLKDRSTAEAIRDCSKKISGPNGDKIVILMRTSHTPPLEDQEIEKIKEVISRRFVSTENHLDASSLYHDSSLSADKIQLKIGPINYHMFVVAKIIAENIAKVVSLDLSNNILGNLDALKLLVPLTPMVTKLNLEKNNIKSLQEIEKLKDWSLTDLTLNNNPLCGNYKSTTEYISDLRNFFPNLTTLDGRTLPPPVKFDVDSSEIPKPIRDYVPETGSDVIQQFIRAYFTCFDESRSNLTEAYHEDSVFTLSIPSSPRGPSLSKYFQLSRNLKRMKNSSLKTSSVCTKRVDVLSKLEKIPRTKHLVASFSIDVPLITSTIVNFIVRGLFKEDGRDGYLRSFSRSFFCQVAPNNSLKIINEQCFIRNPTSMEIKESKSLPSNPAAPPPNQPSVNAISSAMQAQMIQAFCKESGMNAMFSEQCLKENNWNYEAAGKVFLTLKGQGQIPPEAFK